jgi:hypothetical protein
MSMGRLSVGLTSTVLNIYNGRANSEAPNVLAATVKVAPKEGDKITRVCSRTVEDKA